MEGICLKIIYFCLSCFFIYIFLEWYGDKALLSSIMILNLTEKSNLVLKFEDDTALSRGICVRCNLMYIDKCSSISLQCPLLLHLVLTLSLVAGEFYTDWSKYLNDKSFVNFFHLDWNMVISGNHESQYFDWKFWRNIYVKMSDVKMSRCRLLTPQVMTVSLGDLRGRESPPDWEPLSLLPIFGLPSSLVTQLTEPAQPDGDSSLINLNHLSQWRLKSVRQFILSSSYFPILPF